MENSFQLEIIKPEKIIFSGKIITAKLPSYEGDMSILKNHIPIITFLRPGIIIVTTSEESSTNFFVQDGTVEYFNDSLVVLSSSIENIKDLSSKYLDDLNKETENKLSQSDITDHDRYILNHKLDTIRDIRF
jgi:ATP synthase F1 epsilon subunit